MHHSMQVVMEARESVGSPSSGVTGNCDPLDVWVLGSRPGSFLCKSNMDSSLASHHSPVVSYTYFFLKSPSYTK